MVVCFFVYVPCLLSCVYVSCLLFCVYVSCLLFFVYVSCLMFFVYVPCLLFQPDDPIQVRWSHLALLVEFALELKKALQGINEQSFNHFVLKMGENRN